VAEAEPDEFIAIDASHLKTHQDACRHPQSPEIRSLGKTKGGRISKLNASVNGAGKALKLTLAPENRHDLLFAVEISGDAPGKIALGDRGHDNDPLRKHILNGGGIPLIPAKSNRKVPVFYMSEVGRHRRVVENFFCRIKRHRRVATRYDRLTETFTALISLSVIADWV
jgi:transposase